MPGFFANSPRDKEAQVESLVAEVFRRALAGDAFEVEVSDTLDAFRDEKKLTGLDLIRDGR